VEITDLMTIEVKKIYLRHYLTALVKRELDKLKVNYGSNLNHNNIIWKASHNEKTHDRVCVYDIATDKVVVRLYLSPIKGSTTEIGELTLADKIDNKTTYRLWVNLDHNLFTKGYDTLSDNTQGYYAWRCPNLDLYLFEIGAIETEDVFNAILLENGGIIYQEDNPGIVNTRIEEMERKLLVEKENKAIANNDDMKPKLVLVPGPSKVLVGSTYEDPGVIAMDNQSEVFNIKINTSGVVDTNVPGEYKIYYEATDAEGNYMYTQRTIEVVLPTPTIKLHGPSIINIDRGNLYFEQGGTALSWDGKALVLDISNSYIDTGIPGEYTVTYSTIDEDNNSFSITRTVNVN